MWVCGEVLVDLIPQPGSTERVGVIGGGPENTAKALARLGHQVEFIDGISTDKWGVAAKKELDLDGVGTRFVKFSDNVFLYFENCSEYNNVPEVLFVLYEIKSNTLTINFKGSGTSSMTLLNISVISNGSEYSVSPQVIKKLFTLVTDMLTYSFGSTDLIFSTIEFASKLHKLSP